MRKLVVLFIFAGLMGCGLYNAEQMALDMHDIKRDLAWDDREKSVRVIEYLRAERDSIATSLRAEIKVLKRELSVQAQEIGDFDKALEALIRRIRILETDE